MDSMQIHFRFLRRPMSDRRNHPTTPGRMNPILLLAVAMLAITEASFAQTTMSIDHFGAGDAFRPGGSTAVASEYD